MRMNRYHGGHLVEYSLLIGLIALVSYMAVSELRSSLSVLFGQQGAHLSSQPVADYVALTSFNQGSAKAANLSNNSLPEQLDSESVALITKTISDSVNTTSTDGLVESAQHTFGLVKQMNSLSERLTDPKVIAWAKKITRQTHYLAGTEGDYSGVQKLSVEGDGKTSYTSANALRDIYLYRNTLQNLVAHPPKQGNLAEIKQVLALANDALQNTQPFLTLLDPYLEGKSGKLNKGNLAKSQFAQGEHKMTGKRYQDLMKYDALQDNVQEVLEDGSASGMAPLQSTLQDASDLNNTIE